MRRLFVCFALFVLAAAPATAQNWNAAGATLTTDRMADAELLIRVPGVLPGEFTYRIIDFADLLAGLVRFSDTLTRYVAVAASSTNATAPTFTADILTGTYSEMASNSELCIDYPVGPSGETSVWVAVGAPSSVGIDYIGIGVPRNTGRNQIVGFEMQGTVHVGAPEVQYDVWVSRGAHTVRPFGDRTICFNADAE